MVLKNNNDLFSKSGVTLRATKAMCEWSRQEHEKNEKKLVRCWRKRGADT
jgi:hypothetical protein